MRVTTAVVAGRREGDGRHRRDVMGIHHRDCHLGPRRADDVATRTARAPWPGQAACGPPNVIGGYPRPARGREPASKPFVGYSDNTNLHLFLWNLGLVS
jgi:hypothetical protein